MHIELFARRRVVIVPPGIGVGPRGCTYPLRTTAPTGVVHVARRGLTLGDLFRVWGRRLSPSALLSFRGRVSVFVDGQALARRTGRRPVDEARADRARGRRLRRTSSQLSLPERRRMTRRMLLASLALVAGHRRLRRLVEVELPDDRRRAHLCAHGLPAVGSGRGRASRRGSRSRSRSRTASR